MYHHGATVEFLAEELKKLVGWGATPERLALMPNLRRFAGLPPELMDVRREGHVIRRQLIKAIGSLTGSFEFHGRLIPAHDMKVAYWLLFKLGQGNAKLDLGTKPGLGAELGLGTGQGHVDRRGRAIMQLGIHCTIRTWRLPNGPEWDLMLILAEWMTAGPGRAAA